MRFKQLPAETTHRYAPTGRLQASLGCLHRCSWHAHATRSYDSHTVYSESAVAATGPAGINPTPTASMMAFDRVYGDEPRALREKVRALALAALTACGPRTVHTRLGEDRSIRACALARSQPTPVSATLRAPPLPRARAPAHMHQAWNKQAKRRQTVARAQARRARPRPSSPPRPRADPRATHGHACDWSP